MADIFCNEDNCIFNWQTDKGRCCTATTVNIEFKECMSFIAIDDAFEEGDEP